MIKMFILLSLLCVVACNKKDIQAKNPSLTSDMKDLTDDNLTETDKNQLIAICNALSEKMLLIGDLGPTTFKFDYAEKSCEADEIGVALETEVNIVSTYDNYVFKKLNGQNFGFTNVETPGVGVMMEICRDINNIKSPMETSATTATYFTTFPSRRECAADNVNNHCIQIERGYKEGDQYRIKSREWIKFQLKGNRVGFFIERKLVSHASCSNGRALIRTAVLK